MGKRIRAIFKYDIRFDTCPIFELDEKKGIFHMITDEEFKYDKDVVLNDDDFIVFEVDGDEVKQK